MTAVFLDLDGTLVDSKPGILSSLTTALTEVGRGDLAEDDLTWMIGPPFSESFGKIGLADPQAAIDAYRRVYDDGSARTLCDTNDAKHVAVDIGVVHPNRYDD